MKKRGKRDEALLSVLQTAYDQWHRPEFLEGDPLKFAHRYDQKRDQEVVALISAAFASGNIKAISQVLETIFLIMGKSPFDYLINTSETRLLEDFSEVHHRWVFPEDVANFLALISEILRRESSLESLWRRLDDPSEETVLPTLEKFVNEFHSIPLRSAHSRERGYKRQDGKAVRLPSISSILLTSPKGSSACKRMHLFLRWVSRSFDGVDLGLWTDFVDPKRLMMPVDVHVLRFGRRWRLTDRKQPDAKACLQMTKAMRRLSPDDPCRYDFVLVRSGIHELSYR